MQAKKTVFLKQVAGQNILIDMDQSCVNFNKMITINECGVFIWNSLENSIDMDTLIDKVASNYDAPRDVIAQDTLSFINKISALGLVSE